MQHIKAMNYYLIDGYNMAFRSFYAMPALTRADGLPTGALHAFFAGLIKLCSRDTPHKTAVFFDKGGSKRHRETYADYKANRAEMPEDLRAQMPAILELCALMGFCVKSIEGIEADDLLASAAEKLASPENQIFLVSSDKDFAQLVRPGVKQLLPPQKASLDWRELDGVGVRLKFGVSPNQIPDFLALVGDSADNIPGLEGVGPKTAAKWLKDFGNLESIMRRPTWIKPEKFQKIVAESGELLRRNLDLVTLDRNVELGELKFADPDFAGLEKFLQSMEMKRSLLTLKNFALKQYQINL